MANIALGKLPLEDVWKRPEEATDGITTGYDGNKGGFADAYYPATYTLDLEDLKTIHTIRFLLYDGLGKLTPGLGVAKVRDTRKYYYELLISKDSENWESYYQTNNGGFNGWQVFEFKNSPEARFVRLKCFYNTKNAGFHIVEFEVHDSAPNALSTLNPATNTQLLFDPLANYASISKIISTFFNEKQNDFVKQSSNVLEKVKSDAGNIEKIKEEISSKVGEFDKTIQQLNLVGKSLDFQQEADKNKRNSMIWIGFAIASFVTFVCLVWSFLFKNEYHFIKISTEVYDKLKDVNTSTLNTTLLFEFVSFLVLKALFMSLSIYAVVFCVKNYKLQKHNYTVNQHKALSLIASVKLLDNSLLQPETKEKILIQATNAIFSHQNSGYSDKEVDGNPNVFASVIENVKGKVVK